MYLEERKKEGGGGGMKFWFPSEVFPIGLVLS